VFQKPRSDESASIRMALKLARAETPRNLGKAVQGAGARLRVVPGATAHTKEATGATRLNEVNGPVVRIHRPLWCIDHITR